MGLSPGQGQGLPGRWGLGLAGAPPLPPGPWALFLALVSQSGGGLRLCPQRDAGTAAFSTAVSGSGLRPCPALFQDRSGCWRPPAVPVNRINVPKPSRSPDLTQTSQLSSSQASLLLQSSSFAGDLAPRTVLHMGFIHGLSPPSSPPPRPWWAPVLGSVLPTSFLPLLGR